MHDFFPPDFDSHRFPDTERVYSYCEIQNISMMFSVRYTEINDDEANTTNGVPQGTIQSPLIFTGNINK